MLWNLKECIKRKVLQSLSQNPNCSGLVAKDAMEAYGMSVTMIHSPLTELHRICMV